MGPREVQVALVVLDPVEIARLEDPEGCVLEDGARVAGVPRLVLGEGAVQEAGVVAQHRGDEEEGEVHALAVAARAFTCDGVHWLACVQSAKPRLPTRSDVEHHFPYLAIRQWLPFLSR